MTSAMSALKLGLVSFLIVLSGCIPWSYEYSYTVSTRPPAPYAEVVGVAPAPGYVWINGYWWWDGGQYTWIRGYWAPPPQPGYVWVRNGWVNQGGHYVFVRGHWSAPTVHVRTRYVHPAPRVRVRPGARYRYVQPRPGRRAPPRGRPRRHR